MPKVIPKNVADEMTRPYIDDAVDRQLKAADVPPRNKLDISFKDTGRTDDNKDYDSNQDAYEENHGKLYDMTHNNTIPWKNYVVYFVLLSLLTTVFTFSRYMSNANMSGDAKVAAFTYSINSTDANNTSVKYIDNNDLISSIFDLDSNLNKYEFAIENTGDVTVDVFPTKTSTDKSGNGITSRFAISFSKSKDNNTALDKSNGKEYIRLTPGAGTSIYLWIDSSSVANENVEEKLNLDFDIVQVD